MADNNPRKANTNVPGVMEQKSAKVNWVRISFLWGNIVLLPWAIAIWDLVGLEMAYDVGCKYHNICDDCVRQCFQILRRKISICCVEQYFSIRDKKKVAKAPNGSSKING